TPRDIAFCAHAILVPDKLTIVEDALVDPRFADHPLVTGEPYIRFYAGAPLVTSAGFPLGTLCVVDYVPRQLAESQVRSLTLLARQVVNLIQLREVNLALKKEKEKLSMLYSQAPLAIVLNDCLDSAFLDCNPEF